MWLVGILFTLQFGHMAGSWLATADWLGRNKVNRMIARKSGNTSASVALRRYFRVTKRWDDHFAAVLWELSLAITLACCDRVCYNRTSRLVGCKGKSIAVNVASLTLRENYECQGSVEHWTTLGKNLSQLLTKGANLQLGTESSSWLSVPPWAKGSQASSEPKPSHRVMLETNTSCGMPCDACTNWGWGGGLQCNR